MTFLDFFESVFGLFGPVAAPVIVVVAFLLGLGAYKFLKDWLPW